MSREMIPDCPKCRRRHYGDCEGPARRWIDRLHDEMREPQPELSYRQEELLAAIKEYIQEFQRPPVIRELMVMCDISSTSTVHYNLSELEVKGFISRVHGRRQNRTIKLTEKGVNHESQI